MPESSVPLTDAPRFEQAEEPRIAVSPGAAQDQARDALRLLDGERLAEYAGRLC